MRTNVSYHTGMKKLVLVCGPAAIGKSTWSKAYIGEHPEETVFTPRDYQKPQLNIDDMVASMQKTITLRIHNSILDRVLDHCAYEQFAPDDDTHYIVQFPFIENDYYYDMLLSFGNKCECLGPAPIRKELRRRILVLAALYED